MSDVPSGGWSRSAEDQARYNFFGGMMYVAAALILLLTSFLVRNPVPITVRGAIVIFGLVSAAAAYGRLKVQSPQDFFGGMALVLLPLVAFVASNDLPGMRGFAFGPGTAPRLFALTLMVLAIAVVALSLTTRGPDVTPYRLRGIIFILGSILSFAATIRTLGLVIASFTTIIICAAAADDIRWRETVVWGAILTAFCAFLFPYGLNLPFQLWPRFLQ